MLCSKYRKWGERKYILLTSLQAPCPSHGFLGILTCAFWPQSPVLSELALEDTYLVLIAQVPSSPSWTLKVLVYIVISMYIHLYLLVCMCAWEYRSKVSFECSSGTIHLGFLETVCPWPVFLIIIGFPIMQGWLTQGSPIWWCPFLKLDSYATVTDFVISVLGTQTQVLVLAWKTLPYCLSYLLSHLLMYLFICQFKKVFSMYMFVMYVHMIMCATLSQRATSSIDPCLLPSELFRLFFLNLFVF